MATKTPTQNPEESLHGEEEQKPTFPIDDSGSSGVYDDQKTPMGDASDPRGQTVDTGQKASGDSSDPRGPGPDKVSSPQDIKASEEKAGVGAKGAIGAAEKSLYNPNAALPPTLRALNKSVNLLFSKKGARGGGVIAGVLGIVAFMSIVSGPMQIIHFGQQLQGHFDSNRSHSDSRTSAMIFNALAGKGAQNGRLKIVGNVIANKYQKELIDSTGFKPLYGGKQRILTHLEVVDEDKALRALENIRDSNSKSSKAAAKALENKDFVRLGQSDDLIDNKGNRIPPGARTIPLDGIDAGDIRALQISLAKEINANRIAVAVGYRMSAKRSGIGMHPMKKIQRELNKRGIIKATAKQIDRDQKEAIKMEEKMKEEREKAILEGTQEGEAPRAGNTDDTDANGDADTPRTEDVEASDETKKFLNNFKRTGVVKTGGSAAVVVGVLCAAKAYGNGVEEYKYTNNVLPMMRMGMDAVAHGDQTKTGDDFSLENLKLFNDYLYDKKKKTSWTQAESIRVEQGKEGGVPMPEEADLVNVGDKPKLFKTLDSIGPLVAVCGVVDAASNLPIIKQVSTIISDGTTTAIDGALKASGSGTSTKELMEKSLKAVAGRAVDPLAKGADLGNMANTGVFLAANDQALTMGGQALTSQEVAELKQIEEEDRASEQSQKSLAERYLNPYDKYSAVGTLIDASPANLDQAASMISSPAQKLSLGFGGIFSALVPKAKAASKTYDYGVPKYGFSASEERDPQFADPYVNADIVEPELDSLNEKYGDKCFGVTITTDDKGVHIKSSDKPVNTFKVRKIPECVAQTNTDEKFNHYRYYISDVMTAVSLSCYEGDEEHCAELGFKSESITGEEQPASDEASTEIDMDTLYEPSDKIACSQGTKDLGIQDGYHSGKKVKIRVCAMNDVPETGELSDVPGANGKLVVNSRLSAFYVNLVEDAKKAGVQGISATEGFRSMARQECLYSGKCPGTGPARPGYSNHQTGVAVDWSENVWKYLNKEPHGLKALIGGEPWHWSPTGN